MNIFAKIERIKELQFEIVKYFSILLIEEGEGKEKETNEFYQFLNRIEDIPEFEEDLLNLITWIEEIGKNIGAKRYLFRNESIIADVHALPPPLMQMNIHEIIVEKLRLYCLVLNENVVILFNGGIKTTKNAKDCPNVGPHIKMANRMVKKIDDLFKQKDIRWNDDFSDIYYDENLEFEL